MVWLNTLWARLKPGVSVEQARLELQAISLHVEGQDSATGDFRTDVRLLRDPLFDWWRSSVYLLNGIGLVTCLLRSQAGRVEPVVVLKYE